MEIIGDTYTRSWGQLDGAIQTKSTVAEGKNIGKSSETTPEAQAILEAEAVWVKKQKANYSLSPDAPVTVQLPMKVNEYKKHLKKIAEVVFTSPKLNGVNCEYRLENNELKLLSRGGENYPIPVHQEIQARMLLKALGTNRINGEMYIHGEFLQDIMSATKKHNDLTPQLKFHVFDFPEVEGTYQERSKLMYDKNDACVEFNTDNFPFVPVWVAKSPEEIENQYTQVMGAGYEGLMIRNPDGLYEYNKRSLSVFKYKKTQDDEFKVFSHDVDKNGHPVFKCYADKTESLDKVFKVKLKGTAEERIAMAADAVNYYDKFLKVEYEMLSKDGIPQKPVGIMFRKVDADGEALE